MPDWFFTLAKQLTLSRIADVSELLGLGLTLYVFYVARKLRRLYVSKARVPELTTQLKEHASNLAELHGDFMHSKEKVLLEIGKTEVTLRSLRKKVARPTKRSIKVAVKLIDNYSPYNQSPEYLWKLYVELQKIIQEIIEVQSDLAWENPNG